MRSNSRNQVGISYLYVQRLLKFGQRSTQHAERILRQCLRDVGAHCLEYSVQCVGPVLVPAGAIYLGRCRVS